MEPSQASTEHPECRAGATPRKKTKSELTVERRRELAKQFPGILEELQAIAAKCRMKPKLPPPAPRPDAIDTAPAPPPSIRYSLFATQ